MRKYMTGFALFAFVISAFIICWNTYYLKTAMAQAEAAALEKNWKRIDDASNCLLTLCKNLASETVPIREEVKTGKLDQNGLIERLKAVLGKYEEVGAIRFSLSSSSTVLNEYALDQTRILRAGISSSDTVNLIPFLRLPLGSTATESAAAGAFVMEIERWRLKAILLAYDLGEYGFPFLIQTNGSFLWHPHRDFIGEKADLFAVARELSSSSMDDFAISMSKHEKMCMSVELNNERNMWLFGAPLPGFDLAVCGFVNRDELLSKTSEMRRQMYRILIFFFVLLLSAATILLLRRADIADHLWFASGVYTLILTAGTAAIWALTTITFPPYIEGGPPLLEPSYLTKKAETYILESKKSGYQPPYFIPTGVFLKSIALEGATNVKVTGYAWQKYPKDGIAGVEEGITFPEAVESEVEKAYEQTENDVRIIGWNFKLTLREWFDYSTYPFDQQDVWLRMWHVNFDKNIVLVPDLISYSQIDPSQVPGTDEDLILPSWQIKKTFFNFVDYNYNTNFGMTRFAGQISFPELHFHMLIGRNFMEPFMSCILPLFVVALQMFSVLIISTKRESLAERLGFNSGVILQVAAALFFVVIYAQIDLRRRLEAEQIMYMDYFYFTMYFIFIIVSANSIIYAHTDENAFIEFRDNLIPKILFWPVVFGIIFLVTIGYFYP